MNTNINEKLFDLYLSLFPDSSNTEYKTLLLYIVWTTIKENPGITENKLKWLLAEQYSFDETNIDLALSALSNPRLFDGISKFQLKSKKNRNKRKIVHLRPKKEKSMDMHSWESYMLNINPELTELMVS